MSLHARLAALERSQGYTGTEVRIMVVVGVKPGEQGRELTHLHQPGGAEWRRSPGESEQAFEARAKGEAVLNEWGSALLLGCEAAPG